MAVISVPKTPKHAYDPERTPGTLLQSQIQHLEWATRPAAERKINRFVPAKTEAEAAERIAQLTQALHRQTVGREPIAASAATRRPVRRAKRRMSKRKTKRRRSR